MTAREKFLAELAAQRAERMRAKQRINIHAEYWRKRWQQRALGGSSVTKCALQADAPAVDCAACLTVIPS